MRTTLTLFALLALFLSACTPPVEIEQPDPVTLGIVLSFGADPATAGLLETALNAELDRPVTVEVAPSLVALYESLAVGDVDFAHFTPLMAAEAISDLDASLVAIAVRGGGPTYRTQFNARCDLELTGLLDLAGLRFGFVSAGSHSGHYVPYVTLLDVGIDPEDDLTASFAGSHEAVIQGIYDDDFDAGVSFEDGRAAIATAHPDVYDVVCVLGYSDPIPNDAVLGRAGLATDVVQDMSQALISLADDASGQAALEAFGTLFAGFVSGSAGDYDILIRVNEEFF